MDEGHSSEMGEGRTEGSVRLASAPTFAAIFLGFRKLNWRLCYVNLY